MASKLLKPNPACSESHQYGISSCLLTLNTAELTRVARITTSNRAIKLLRLDLKISKMQSSNTKMGDQKLEEIKINLRSVLMSSTVGVSLKSLKSDYEELCGERLDNRQFGFQHLSEFLKCKCSDVCRLGADKDNPGMYRAFVIADEDTKHIEELQRHTRKPPKKKKTPRRTYPPTHRSGYTSGGGYNNYVPNYNLAHNKLVQDQYNRIRMMNNAMLMYNMNMNLIQSYQTRPYYSNNFYSSTPRVNKVARNNVPATKDKHNDAVRRQRNHEKPKAKKQLKLASNWELYGGYVLSILCTKKFGMLKGDLEEKYEEKFRESLPQDWVQQLDKRMIEIVQDYGDGILLVKAKSEGNKSEDAAVNTAEHNTNKDNGNGNKFDDTEIKTYEEFSDTDSDSDWDVRQCNQDIIMNVQTRNSLVDSSSTSAVAESLEDQLVEDRTVLTPQILESSAISKPKLTASSSVNSVDASKEKNHSKQFIELKKNFQDQQVKEESEYSHSVKSYHGALRQNTLKTQSAIASLPSLFDILRTYSKSEN